MKLLTLRGSLRSLFFIEGFFTLEEAMIVSWTREEGHDRYERERWMQARSRYCSR